MLIHYKTCVEIMTACHGSAPTKVLHIGAHAGEEASFYSQQGVQEVIWFEANESLIPQLKKNVSAYAMRQQIVPVALWSSNETLRFNITNNVQSSSVFELNTHSTHYPGIRVTEVKKVKAYRLEGLTGLREPLLNFTDFEFVNIDTQGAELAILKGFGSLIDQPSIKGIYLEVNREKLYKEIPLIEEIDEFMASHKLHRIISCWTNAGWGDAFYLRSREESC